MACTWEARAHVWGSLNGCGLWTRCFCSVAVPEAVALTGSAALQKQQGTGLCHLHYAPTPERPHYAPTPGWQPADSQG